MRIIDDIEAAAPQIRAARLALYALAGLIAAGLLGFAIWWFFIHPRHVSEKAAQDHVDSVVANGAAGATEDTMHIIVGVDRRRDTIDATTRENDDAIKAAQGAGDSVGADLDHAGRGALCMRDAYSTASWCAAVRRAGPGVGAVGADAGGSAARQ